MLFWKTCYSTTLPNPFSTQKVFDESFRALRGRSWGWWSSRIVDRVINQIPKKCGSKSSKIPARLYLKSFPPPPPFPFPLGIGGFRGTLELHLSLNSRESRRVQTAEHSAIKREVNMFYLPNGITHNIYVCLVIHGGVSTVAFLLWVPPGILEGLLSEKEARICSGCCHMPWHRRGRHLWGAGRGWICLWWGMHTSSCVLYFHGSVTPHHILSDTQTYTEDHKYMHTCIYIYCTIPTLSIHTHNPAHKQICRDTYIDTHTHVHKNLHTYVEKDLITHKSADMQIWTHKNRETYKDTQ